MVSLWQWLNFVGITLIVSARVRLTKVKSTNITTGWLTDWLVKRQKKVTRQRDLDFTARRSLSFRHFHFTIIEILCWPDRKYCFQVPTTRRDRLKSLPTNFSSEWKSISRLVLARKCRNWKSKPIFRDFQVYWNPESLQFEFVCFSLNKHRTYTRKVDLFWSRKSQLPASMSSLNVING